METGLNQVLVGLGADGKWNHIIEAELVLFFPSQTGFVLRARRRPDEGGLSAVGVWAQTSSDCSLQEVSLSAASGFKKPSLFPLSPGSPAIFLPLAQSHRRAPDRT